MTGYGKAKFTSKELTLEIEFKTVNNRYLDINLKLPRDYSEYELSMREEIQKHLKRGRVEVQISRQVSSKFEKTLDFNADLLKELLQIHVREAKKAKLDIARFTQAALIELLARKDVLDLKDAASTNPKEKAIVFDILKKALKNLLEFRSAEGSRLLKDILSRIDQIRTKRSSIAKITKSSIARSRQTLLARIDSLAADVKLNPERLEAEVALLATRADVTEELVRLDSHLQSFESELRKHVDGKKLEFLLQEVLREFNTIASKSNSAEITGLVVEAKTEIERIREQVQNLE